MPSGIALDYLSPIQRAQLRHCRPDIFEEKEEIERCKRCGGRLFNNYGEITCFICGAEHDKQGNWLEPVLVFGIDTKSDGRPPRKRYIR